MSVTQQTKIIAIQSAIAAAYSTASADDVIIYIIHSSTNNYEVADSIFNFREESQK